MSHGNAAVSLKCNKDFTADVIRKEDIRKNFLQAMRLHTSTVAIITKAHEGSALGMTATAVCSLTADPPAILACINLNATICRWLTVGAALCVNLLAEEHSTVAQGFAGKIPADERFKSGHWSYNGEGVPYLKDSLSSIFCRVDARNEYNTHAVLACLVEDVFNSESQSPLLYGNGLFHAIGHAV